MGVGQLSESDAVDALRLPFYSSSHPTGSHGWRNQFDLGNPDSHAPRPILACQSIRVPFDDDPHSTHLTMPETARPKGHSASFRWKRERRPIPDPSQRLGPRPCEPPPKALFGQVRKSLFAGTTKGGVIEVKGLERDNDPIKRRWAQEYWVPEVNRHPEYGQTAGRTWAYYLYLDDEALVINATNRIQELIDEKRKAQIA